MTLLVYPPFAPPGIMPYSLAHLKGMIDEPVKALDLNAEFHRRRFSMSMEELAGALPVYEANNKTILEGGYPEFFDELLGLIRSQEPELVAFSLVYNSQCFYAQRLIEQLEVPVILGGPAVSPKLDGTHVSADELSHYFHVTDGEPDFSDCDARGYLSSRILPVKSSDGCFHARCAFCTHHRNSRYVEHPIRLPEGRYFFFIDDMITVKRLRAIADAMPAGARWWAQLRPTRDLIPHLPYLARSGLASVAWGVESGSQRMLNRMRKGTRVQDMEAVLQAAKRAGIINTVHIMSGFPGETREDFESTVRLLCDNDSAIDLVSPSCFGLQKGSYVYEHPEEFGISVHHERRTFLDDSVSFTPRQTDYTRRFRRTIAQINKLPRSYLYMKEQTLLLE